MENNKDGKISGVRAMSRKERYEFLLKQVSEVKQEMLTANTEDSVYLALNKLDGLIGKLSKDSQVADIASWLSDIAGTIHAVRLHDVTRSALDDMLNEFIKACEAIIAEEKKKENAGKLRMLFLLLAEHSEDIATLIGDIDIFG